MSKIKLIYPFILVFVIATNARSQNDGEDLSTTANSFFRTWIVDRNVDAAIKYLSSKPVLGSCMTPSSLETKNGLTPIQIKNLFRSALGITLEKLPTSKKLNDSLTSQETDIISEDDGTKVAHSAQKYFSIYTLKSLDDVKDNGYVCKFTERKSFLEAISSPDVFYIFTRVKVRSNNLPFILITVWEKENKNWRILTFSVTTDDN